MEDRGRINRERERRPRNKVARLPVTVAQNHRNASERNDIDRWALSVKGRN